MLEKKKLDHPGSQKSSNLETLQGTKDKRHKFWDRMHISLNISLKNVLDCIFIQLKT